MISPRFWTLAIGPLAIVTATYWLTMPFSAQGNALAPAAQPISPREQAGSKMRKLALTDACRQRAHELTSQLSDDCRVIVRPPYVLAGDLTDAQLDRQYRETILPTAHALSIMYFDAIPDEPISILLFAREASYRQHAQKLDGSPGASYHGYYRREPRRIILNLATGNGTLAHELTHALAHFDFPEMPEWFDEGLASLHEQCEFSDDGLHLTGQSNWRLHYLQPIVRQNRVQSLESLMSGGSVRPEQQALDYAHSRYLCLFLQQRGLLGPFYRKLRERGPGNASPSRTLRELLQLETLDSFDREFREWVLTLSKTSLR